jgi:4-hydroxy-2-oxoglutarate aldolase
MLGATGGIMALANVAPNACQQIYQWKLAGNYEQYIHTYRNLCTFHLSYNVFSFFFFSFLFHYWVRARELQNALIPLNEVITSRFGVAGLKALMELIGFRCGPPRYVVSLEM